MLQDNIALIEVESETELGPMYHRTVKPQFSQLDLKAAVGQRWKMVDIDTNVPELDAKELSEKKQGARVPGFLLTTSFILEPRWWLINIKTDLSCNYRDQVASFAAEYA